MSAMAVETGLVTSTRLADGLLVQLQGDLGADQVPALRAALLATLPSSCSDVVVDAGEVTDMGFEALAILFAGWAWIEEQGARFLLSRTSAAFEQVLDDNGVADDLPRLGELSKAPVTAVIPLPRAAIC